MEHVNHPRHYNARPDGLECIEIVRHYTFDIGCAIKYLWRAGLKVEMGKPNREKEIEDLQKALWYITDYAYNTKVKKEWTVAFDKDMSAHILHTTGKDIVDITLPYGEFVSDAIENLLFVGLIHDNRILHIADWQVRLQLAQSAIQKLIEELKRTELK